MSWFLLFFVLTAVGAQALYQRRRRKELRERMELLRFEMKQHVRELQEANAEAEEALECCDFR